MQRRDFLKNSAAGLTGLSLAPVLSGCSTKGMGLPGLGGQGVVVNDVQSQLNATTVHKIYTPRTAIELQRVVRESMKDGRPISISGARHAMGGQQFGTDNRQVDIRGMDRVVSFDAVRGEIEVQAGITWPKLMHELQRYQSGNPVQWGIIQKQTGADELTLGGALSANVHGRGLNFRPFIQDISSFNMVTPSGELVTCSREENADLFSLAVGGYGLFGLVESVRLRLMRRKKVRREVRIAEIGNIPGEVARLSDAGYMYGDFQFSIDPLDDGFLKRGIFTAYKTVDDATPLTPGPAALGEEGWKHLYHLAHTDKGRAFDEYSGHYLSTHGQIYWSDDMQRSVYVPGYNKVYTRMTGQAHKSSLMITELYVPRDRLAAFMADVAADARARRMNIIYGTVRFIRQDNESFLNWATQDYACVIFNLEVRHTPEGINDAVMQFRALINHAITHKGCYYLTYHRWATQQQVEKCYPQMRRFLEFKQKFDPQEIFQSDWYRHYRDMYGIGAV